MMRNAWMAVAAAAAVMAAPGHARAADPVKRLARRLEKGLVGEPARKVAVLGFPYPDGSSNMGSAVIQERLTTFLAEEGDVEVVERQLLQKILEERRLAQSGLIDARTSQEIGKVLGVQALVTGTLNDLSGGRTEINARAIDAATGRILSAGQAVVDETWARGGAARTPDPAPARRGLAQIAILLDTSGSMDGLIEQAKTQLWRIVNEVASSRKDGTAPEIQVALYEYGNDGIPMRDRYVRQVVGFTGDLDRVSEQLFALRTNGGSEYTGAAIEDSIRRLAWSTEPGAYRAIFIAGNEPFTQGPVPYREAIAEAVRRGIVVNTVFCGNAEEGARTRWLDGAQAGGGEYLVIDHDARVAYLQAPQDAEITRLSFELNGTFVPLGPRGAARAANAAAQDQNALRGAAAGAPVERALFKAAPQYAAAAAEWDAVSQVAAGRKAEELKEEELPDDLRRLSPEERTKRLEAKAAERRRIEAKIQALQAERARYLKEKREAGEKSTLGEAMIAAVRKQAGKKGYAFKS